MRSKLVGTLLFGFITIVCIYAGGVIIEVPNSPAGVMLIGGGVGTATTTTTPSDNVLAGSYVGDDQASRGISSLGFQPTAVIVRSAGAANAWIRVSGMAASTSFSMTSRAYSTTCVTSLDADGFTVVNHASAEDLNTTGVTYHYVAFNGTTNFACGTYTGTGATTQDISLTFTPGCVITCGADSSGMFKVAQMTTSNGGPMGASAILANTIAIGTNKFTVGTSEKTNYSGEAYCYIAFKSGAANLVTGTYTGTNPTDDEDVTGVGFTSSFVMTYGAASRANYRFSSVTPLTTDSSWNMNGALATDYIQKITADGFERGASVHINSNGEAYYYVCID